MKTYLSQYIGLKYGMPYDCFGLVISVRKQLGLETPLLPDVDMTQCIKELKRHRKLDVWKPRKTVFLGELGDIILLSQSADLPPHHSGVFVSAHQFLHVEPEKEVEIVRLSETWLRYPGVYGRWFYAG